MRVALLTYSTKPRGGVVHTLALAEALARLGEDVTVVTLGRGGDGAFYRTVDAAVRQWIIPFPDVDGEDVGSRIERSITAVRDGFDASGFDIVHAEDCITANAVEGAIRTVHHVDVFTTPRLVECHDRAIREPRALVCVSEAVAAEVEAGWGRTPTVIPNGIDAEEFAAASGPAASDDREVWRAELGEYVLAVGGIEPRKGTLDLIPAFALAREGHPELRLVVAGGETLFDYSDYRRRVDELASSLRVPPTLLGTVPQERMPALVAAARALGFLSTKEGFGMAAMEALAAGVPVVVRDLPVFREVFGDAVLYASDVSGMAEALGAAVEGRAPDAARGRALARGYDWNTAAERHRALYRSLGRA